MPATSDIGTGVTITFGTSSFAARVASISIDGMSREAIETSHLATTVDAMGGRTYIPGDLVGAGTLTLEIHFDPTLTPPIGAAAESITITFVNTEASTWQFSGFATAFSASIPLEDLMTGSLTVQITGKITITV